MHNLLRKDEYHNVFVAMCPHISKENIMTRKYYYDAILCYYDNFNARISTKVDSIFEQYFSPVVE